MSGFRKMLKLEWTLFKLSAIADLQVPVNLGIQFVNDILWYLLQIVLFEAIYLHVDQLGGWGLPEMRVFLGVLFVVDGFQMVFFAHNFDVFSDRVVRRDLDLLLLRPVSSQQLMACQKLQCGYILNLVFATAWLAWSLHFIPAFTWDRVWLLPIVILAALTVFYSTRFLFCALALWMARADQFHEFYFTLFKLGQRPDRLYGPGLRYFVLLMLPVGMIASVPTRVLVDQSQWALLALVAAASISLTVCHFFWKCSVNRYMTTG